MTQRQREGMLILVRHGQSTANVDGTFTGVLDVDLTPTGAAESRHVGQLLRTEGFVPDAVFTSTLRRAIKSTRLVLDVLKSTVVPLRDWRLNERNYGVLTSRAKADVLAEYGEDQFLTWRRSVDSRPPPMGDELFTRLASSPPFSRLPVNAFTRTESLRDVIARMDTFVKDELFPRLHRGETVLVVAHGNSLRALCAILDHLSDADVQALEIPNGQPLVYQLARGHRPSPRGGRYLDPAAATAAADALASQGGT